MFSICQVKVKVLTKVKSVKRLIRVRTSIKSAAKKTNMGCGVWTLASTFSSPSKGRWNVLNCFVFSDG